MRGFFYVLLFPSSISYFCIMGVMKRIIEQNQNSNRSRWRDKSNVLGNRGPLDITIENVSYTDQYQREQDKEAVATFNAKLMGWGYKVRQQLVASIRTRIETDRILSNSLKVHYRHWGKPVKAGQEITSIGFSFVEEGLYVHLGVGVGYNMQNGTRVLTKKSDKVWRRFPIEWFNPIVEQNIPDLERIVTDYCGKLIINTTRIYINR